MRPRWFALAVAVALAAAGPAHAQSLVAFGGAPGKIISETDAPVTISGQLVVSFHGDPGSGCQASGLCGYSGTVVVAPGSGDLLVVKSRQGRRINYLASLALLGSGPEQSLTLARVERAGGAGLCADAQQPLQPISVDVKAGIATLSLLERGYATLATRCAGPLDGDVSSVAPVVRVPLRALVRGHLRVSLSGSRTFAAGGFAGTVTSTIALAIGQPRTQGVSSSLVFPPGIKTQRVRTVTQALSGSVAGGSLTASVNGTTDTTQCMLLDSCGLAGTMTLSPGVQRLTGSVFAMGPDTRPYGDFLAALGLGRGNPRGIRVLGEASWSAAGTVSADLTQSGTCSDTGPSGPGYVTLVPRASTLAAAYVPANPPRTRCPGPIFPQGQVLASGSVPLSALGQRTFSFALSDGSSFQDDGYTAATHGRLTLTIRRGRITQQVSTQPAGG